MGDTAIAADDWVRTVLGIDVSSKPQDVPGGSQGGGDAPGGRRRGKPVSVKKPDANSPISKAARDPKVWTESVGPALTRQGDYKTGARIKAPPTGPAQVCTGPTGRQVKVVTGADGRVALTRDPPPITEITFSGGGGKGAALPGAIKALGRQRRPEERQADRRRLGRFDDRGHARRRNHAGRLPEAERRHQVRAPDQGRRHDRRPCVRGWAGRPGPHQHGIVDPGADRALRPRTRWRRGSRSIRPASRR